jgi:hypothetical protein
MKDTIDPPDEPDPADDVGIDTNDNDPPSGMGEPNSSVFEGRQQLSEKENPRTTLAHPGAI